ncbi:MAG: hypothetical protein M3453_09740, partial [Pseudomonadota bacterium]|nr:hypothetical protein [Pseudomonadota bacterium]
IVKVLDIDPETLRFHYRRELEASHVRTNAKVAENLYRKATGDGREAVTAAIFWLKTRARWKETSVHELGGASELPPLRIERIERVIIDPREPKTTSASESSNLSQPASHMCLSSDMARMAPAGISI